jgi:hypothetical protein
MLEQLANRSRGKRHEVAKRVKYGQVRHPPAVERHELQFLFLMSCGLYL